MIRTWRRRWWHRGPGGRTGRRLTVAVALGCLVAGLGLAALAPSAGASPGTLNPVFPVTGNATWFTALGAPYGGCGLPQENLDSPHFIALNVYNTPNDYTMYQRPLTGANASKTGMWDNGHNCGRWVQVTVSDYCNGVNDGAAGQAFCRNGQYVADKYNGAVLNMIVADSCGDPNGWCRDDPYHIDLAQASINQFQLNGAPVGDLLDHWNNRHVSWKFIPAPSYSGDVQIGLLQGSQAYWTAVAVSHLANGLHSVQYYSQGAWHDAAMDGDMGQAYLISPLTQGGTDFRIRATDVDDKLINGGREYSFSLPASCGTQCSAAYTKVSYTASTPGGTPSPSVSPSTTPSTTPSSTPIVTPTTTPSVTPSATPSPTPGTAACTARYAVVSSWAGGFQGQVTITAGAVPITRWAASWPLASGQTVTQAWNGQLSTSGGTATVTNAGYNGSVAAGASTSFGFIGGGAAPSPAPAVSCSAG